MRFVHTNIVAEDWQRLAEFYAEVFDCTPVPPQRNLAGLWLQRGTGVEGAAIRGVHLRLPGYGDDGPTLEIFTWSDTVANAASVANRKGFGHIAFAVNDVEATVAALEAHGGSLAGEVTRTRVAGAGVLTFVYAKDPEGNIVEVQAWE